MENKMRKRFDDSSSSPIGQSTIHREKNYRWKKIEKIPGKHTRVNERIIFSLSRSGKGQSSSKICVSIYHSNQFDNGDVKAVNIRLKYLFGLEFEHWIMTTKTARPSFSSSTAALMAVPYSITPGESRNFDLTTSSQNVSTGSTSDPAYLFSQVNPSLFAYLMTDDWWIVLFCSSWKVLNGFDGMV